jgi:hypothetical protein
MTLKQLLKKAKFDWVNPYITEANFPDDKLDGKVEIIHFDKSITSEDATKELDNKGYRPATLRELIKFAIDNPDEQKKYPIVALGSVRRSAGGRRGVSYLGCSDGGRELGLGWWDLGWVSDCRFAAVSKSNSGKLETKIDLDGETITIKGVEYKLTRK